MAVEVVCVCSLDCERHTELVELCQAQVQSCARLLCQVGQAATDKLSALLGVAQ